MRRFSRGERRVPSGPVLDIPPGDLFTKHGGMLRTSKALRLGIHPRTLYALRDTGEIEQVGPGLYRLSTAPALSNPDLVPIAIQIPRAVVCLISALAHHGLTTQVPSAVDLALPNHAQIPKVDGVPLRVSWYAEPSFSVGIDVVTINDIRVRIHSREKRSLIEERPHEFHGAEKSGNRGSRSPR